MEFIALIPARGGSKGIPRKNLVQVCGRPLIEYTIDAALDSPAISRVIVSTDDDEISQVALGAGAEVPFIRPKDIAGDQATAMEVMSHAAETLKLDERNSSLVYLQPTSPLRSSENIAEAVSLFTDQCADTVVSVCEVPHQYRVESQMELVGQRLKPVVQGGTVLSRQAKPVRYARNGPAVLICRTSNIMKRIPFYDEQLSVVPYVMSPLQSHDIDNELDLVIADSLINHFRGNPCN